MISEEDFREAISQSPVAHIVDASGNTTYLTGEQLSKSGLAGQVPASTARTVYKTPTGWSTKLDENYMDVSVSLDKKSGKITVNAPSIVIKNQTFKDNLGAQLQQLSSDFKNNPDYKSCLCPMG